MGESILKFRRNPNEKGVLPCVVQITYGENTRNWKGIWLTFQNRVKDITTSYSRENGNIKEQRWINQSRRKRYLFFLTIDIWKNEPWRASSTTCGLNATRVWFPERTLESCSNEKRFRDWKSTLAWRVSTMLWGVRKDLWEWRERVSCSVVLITASGLQGEQPLVE